MSDSSFTLRNIFSIPASTGGNPPLEQWPQIERGITSEFSGINWVKSMPAIAPKIDELFNIDISNVFVLAWNKATEIQKVRNESRESIEKVFYVELAEHTITSKHKPYVEMSFRHSPAIKIVELTIDLSMKLKGLQLKILKGEIMEVAAGTCEIEGTIEWKGLVIKKKKLDPIKLPGAFHLRD